MARTKQITADVDAIRVQAIQDTIRAIIAHTGAGGDAVCDTEEMRAVAAALQVPYLIVAFAEAATCRPEYRRVTPTDVEEWLRWRDRHPAA